MMCNHVLLLLFSQVNEISPRARLRCGFDSRRERCSNRCALRLFANVREPGLRLIRSLPLAHPSGFVYVARFPLAPFPPGTVL